MHVRDTGSGLRSKPAGLSVPAEGCAAQFRDARIASVSCRSDSDAGSGSNDRSLESERRFALRLRFVNRFRLELPDGQSVEESARGEVRSGEWLHVTYRMPSRSQ